MACDILYSQRKFSIPTVTFKIESEKIFSNFLKEACDNNHKNHKSVFSAVRGTLISSTFPMVRDLLRD